MEYNSAALQPLTDRHLSDIVSPKLSIASLTMEGFSAGLLGRIKLHCVGVPGNFGNSSITLHNLA